MLRPLTPEQAELAGQYYWLALKLARRAANRSPALGVEIEGAATLGLIEAASKFDPSRGVKFSTFAFALINNRIRDAYTSAFAKRSDRRRECRLDVSCPEPWRDDPLPDGAEAMLGLLNEREALGVRLYVLDGKMFDEVAPAVGLSSKWGARLLVRRGLARLRERLVAAG